MGVRMYEFITGIEASAQPDAGPPVLPNDLVTLSYLEAYSERMKKVGTYAAPNLIDAATTVDPTIEASKDAYLMFIAGDGADQEMSAVPQIVAPGRPGIELILVGVGAYEITFHNGDGLALNGPKTLGDKDSLRLISIDASTWQEAPTE